MRGSAVERDIEDEVATVALPRCQGSTWTTTGCIRGSVYLHIPALLPLPICVTHISILITTLTTCGLGMIRLIDSPRGITHLPLEGTPMAPHFEEIHMITILVLYLPLALRGAGAVVFLLPHLLVREEAQLNVSVRMVCLIWKSS